MLELAKLLPAEHGDVSDEFLRVHSAVRRVRFVAITSSKCMHEFRSASPPSFFHSSAIGPLRRLIRNRGSCAILSYGGRLHALTLGEHFLRLLLLDSLPQRRRCCHLLLILHVHPAAPDHRRILRAPHHRCVEQNVRAPPVHVCFIWIRICDTVVSSRPACSLKVSKSQACLGILTETTLAHTCLCVGDHLLQCSS